MTTTSSGPGSARPEGMTNGAALTRTTTDAMAPDQGGLPPPRHGGQQRGSPR
ncbi:MAG: hypothetical protein IPI13_16525 [Actinomycetales bacterium]|uniref:Uncharacterized protein n=1 Tax=Candidatus Phosphoribacter hodrii TaxID=2953743 RepID=A0A935INX2_9MICO|nr:hypothetical protein [Candidatus Phosphoribacter hodrii]